MNTFDKVLETRRTIRRFCDRPIAREDMEQLLNLARLAPSGANLQPLRYIAVPVSYTHLDVYKRQGQSVLYIRRNRSDLPGIRRDGYEVLYPEYFEPVRL